MFFVLASIVAYFDAFCKRRFWKDWAGNNHSSVPYGFHLLRRGCRRRFAAFCYALDSPWSDSQYNWYGAPISYRGNRTFRAVEGASPYRVCAHISRQTKTQKTITSRFLRYFVSKLRFIQIASHIRWMIAIVMSNIFKRVHTTLNDQVIERNTFLLSNSFKRFDQFHRETKRFIDVFGLLHIKQCLSPLCYHIIS